MTTGKCWFSFFDLSCFFFGTASKHHNANYTFTAEIVAMSRATAHIRRVRAANSSATTCAAYRPPTSATSATTASTTVTSEPSCAPTPRALSASTSAPTLDAFPATCSATNETVYANKNIFSEKKTL